MQDVLDLGRRDRWLDMFPEPQDPPTSRMEGRISICISSNVRSQLCGPPFPVRFRQGPVDGASVPETTIHKYSHLLAGKDQIGSPANPRERLAINEKS